MSRLEEIKSRAWKEKGTYAMGGYSQREGYIYTLSDYDYEWLTEQAERVQELEEENRLLRFIAEENKIAYEQRAKQNKRYREAFNSIMTLWKYSEDRTDFEWLAHKMSEEARKALEEEEK